MYAFLSIALFFIGVALIVLVLVRKMPALVELPEVQRSSRPSVAQRVWALVLRVDWERLQHLVLRFLARIVDAFWRFLVRLARRTERWARTLNLRVLHISDLPHLHRASSSFSDRIRKRAAFVEEERRLIEQLSARPDDLDSYRRLGNLYVIAGNVQDARAAFSQLLRLDPSDTEAQRRLHELAGNGRDSQK